MNGIEIYNLIIEKNKQIEYLKNENKKIKLCEYIGTISSMLDEEKAEFTFNYYAFDIIEYKNTVSPEFKKKMNLLINDNLDIIRDNIRVERRAFCKFLELRYGKYWNEVYFLDRESPDYFIYEEDNIYAYEVVEAISGNAAQFDKMCRKNLGRGKKLEEYNNYIRRKHRLEGKSFRVVESQGAVCLSKEEEPIEIANRIVDAIVKKIEKYKDYNIEGTLAEKNILVHVSELNLGFDYEGDYKRVGVMISTKDEIKNSEIDKIFILSLRNRTLTVYNRFGERI